MSARTMCHWDQTYVEHLWLVHTSNATISSVAKDVVEHLYGHGIMRHVAGAPHPILVSRWNDFLGSGVNVLTKYWRYDINVIGDGFLMVDNVIGTIWYI